jgi:hypothetical protein
MNNKVELIPEDQQIETIREDLPMVIYRIKDFLYGMGVTDFRSGIIRLNPAHQYVFNRALLDTRPPVDLQPIMGGVNCVASVVSGDWIFEVKVDPDFDAPGIEVKAGDYRRFMHWSVEYIDFRLSKTGRRYDPEFSGE